MVLVLLHIFLQIVLEVLPVSSSGNVALFSNLFFGESNYVQSVVMLDALDFLLHGSTVFVVGCYFFKTWWSYLKGFVQGDRKCFWLVFFCVVADCLTVGFYFLFGVTGVTFFPLWLGFLVTGGLLWSLQLVSGSSRLKPQDDTSRYRLSRMCSRKKHCCMCHPERSVRIQDNLNNSLFHAAILGIVQGIALLPGISRFGSTFVAGRWLGLSREKAFEFSFLIAWPLMVAGFLKGCWQLYHTDNLAQLLRLPVLFSILIATTLSWFVLNWVWGVIKRGQLWKFCWWLWFLALVAILKKV